MRLSPITRITIPISCPPARGFQALFNYFFLRGYVSRMLKAEVELLADYVAKIDN